MISNCKLLKTNTIGPQLTTLRGEGVQAYPFGKKYFELGVGGIGSNFFGGLNKKNRLQFVCAKSIFKLIPRVSDKFIEKCRRSRLFGE